MTEKTMWRPSSPSEIQSYYEDEFPAYIDSIPEWITPDGPLEYAISLNKSYPVEQHDEKTKNRNKERNFIRRSTIADSDSVRFTNWENLADFFAAPVQNDPMLGELKPRPGLRDPESVEMEPNEFPVSDAVYYHTDHNERFWVLAFDIDAKDVAVEAHRTTGDKRKKSEILNQSGVADKPPVGPNDIVYEYRYDDISQAISYAFDLADWLESELEYSDTRIFYTGQGAHVYALDDDPEHRYTLQSRQFLTTYIEEKLDAADGGGGIPIDDKVTADDSRVLRVPWSLHTDVSRIVVPVESPDFDFRADSRTLPSFLSAAEVSQ